MKYQWHVQIAFIADRERANASSSYIYMLTIKYYVQPYELLLYHSTTTFIYLSLDVQ